MDYTTTAIGCLPGLQGLGWANYVVGSIICGITG